MNISLQRFILPSLLATSVLISACSQQNSERSESTSEDKVLQELSSEPIKPFPKTANDEHDILILTEYDERYNDISDDMEDELKELKEKGNLSAEFAYIRKKDNLLSASEMLKALDLKTEQGRYIQGRIANYWDTQLPLLEKNKDKANDDKALAEDRLKGLGDYLHAQDQLEQWRAQYPNLDKDE